MRYRVQLIGSALLFSALHFIAGAACTGGGHGLFALIYIGALSGVLSTVLAYLSRVAGIVVAVVFVCISISVMIAEGLLWTIMFPTVWFYFLMFFFEVFAGSTIGQRRRSAQQKKEIQGHAVDVEGQVAEGVIPGAYGRGMEDPGLTPEAAGSDGNCRGGMALAERIAEAGAKRSEMARSGTRKPVGAVHHAPPGSNEAT